MVGASVQLDEGCSKFGESQPRPLVFFVTASVDTNIKRKSEAPASRRTRRRLKGIHPVGGGGGEEGPERIKFVRGVEEALDEHQETDLQIHREHPSMSIVDGLCPGVFQGCSSTWSPGARLQGAPLCGLKTLGPEPPTWQPWPGLPPKT